MWSDFMHHLPDGYVTHGYRAISYWSEAPIWLKILASIPNDHFRRLTARVAIKKRVVVLVSDQSEREVEEKASIVDSKGKKTDQVKNYPTDVDVVAFELNSTLRLVKSRKFRLRKRCN